MISLFELICILQATLVVAITPLANNGQCCTAGKVHFHLGNNCDTINATTTSPGNDPLGEYTCLLITKSCCLRMHRQTVYGDILTETLVSSEIRSYIGRYIEYEQESTGWVIETLAKQYSCERRGTLSERLDCVNCHLGLLAALGEVSPWPKTELAHRFARVNPICTTKKSNQTEPYVQCCEQTVKILNETIRWCNVQPALCQHRCQESTGSGRFECSCYEGYRLANNGRDCVDVDECSEGTHNCDTSNERCSNTDGGFQCLAKLSLNVVEKCQPGYYFNITYNRCKDIDECWFQLHNCNSNSEVCRNLLGSFECLPIRDDCPSGFRKVDSNSTSASSRRFNCIDIDECATRDTFDCDPTLEVCDNYIGSYTCELAKPETNPHIVDNVVNENREAETISCPKGFRFNRFSFACDIDIDECQIGQHHCDLTLQKCVNFKGSFACVPLATSLPTPSELRVACDRGYVLDDRGQCEDLDECVTLPCPLNTYCQNTIGSFVCHCKTGFIRNNHSAECEDIDECAQRVANCIPGLVCKNRPGSYDCVYPSTPVTSMTSPTIGPPYSTRLGSNREIFNLEANRYEPRGCGQGERIIGGKCEKVLCGVGFFYNQTAKRCQDYNECLHDVPCGRRQKCTNTIGSYRCTVKCDAGYTSNFARDACLDVDECAERVHTCPVGKECINLVGSYRCQCLAGFAEQPNGTCTDIDECEHGYSICDASLAKRCINTVGSYKCDCKDGFRSKVDSAGRERCLDVDECQDPKLNGCSHKCFNTHGSYRCECPAGYRLDSDHRTCVDIDECRTFSNRTEDRPCYYRCENTPGSFRCVCPSGYESFYEGHLCKDIDECEKDSLCTGSGELCLNVRGSYRCNVITCPKGYYLDEDSLKCIRHLDGIMGYLDLSKPISYSYNYVSIVSNITIPKPEGYLDIMAMSGPVFDVNGIRFNLTVVKVKTATRNLKPASMEDFLLRRTDYNRVIVSLLNPIQGPQDIQLQLTVSLYHQGEPSGSSIAILNIIVSEYTF